MEGEWLCGDELEWVRMEEAAEPMRTNIMAMLPMIIVYFIRCIYLDF